MELDALPHFDPIPYRERPAPLIHPHDLPDQEVPPPWRELVLVDRPANVQALAEQCSILGREPVRQLLEPNKRRAASQLVDDVPFGPGHRVDVADRPASLGDEGPNADAG